MPKRKPFNFNKKKVQSQIKKSINKELDINKKKITNQVNKKLAKHKLKISTI